MAARPIQISMDSDLLNRIDKDPEVRERGRSAFIRSAVEFYLVARRRRELDRRISRAYQDQADSMLDEVTDMIASQSWPKK